MKKSEFYNELEKKYNELKEKTDILLNGGKGSGNFGHAGRPGEVGGSSATGSGKTSKGSGEQVDTRLVAEATMLRDHTDMGGKYLDKEHEMLCDIADTLYNAGVGPEQLKSEYKELYDKYGKDYFDQVTAKMGDIDDATQTVEDSVALYQTYMKRKDAGGKTSEGKYSVKDGKEARKYLTADGNVILTSPEQFGYTYDESGKPTRLSRFEKDADDKLWSAWASMQKVADDGSLGDVTREGLALAYDAKRLAQGIIATSQTAYLPSERATAERQTEKLIKGVKDEIKKLKIKLAADTKKYGDTETRKATRKALDDISSAMGGFIGYDKSSIEYKD